MKALIAYVSGAGLVAVIVTSLAFYQNIKRLKSYRSNVILGVAHSMVPYDEHTFERQHPNYRK